MVKTPKRVLQVLQGSEKNCCGILLENNQNRIVGGMSYMWS